MQRQKLTRIVVYTVLVVFVYLFIKVLSLTGQSDQVTDVVEVEVRRFSRYGFRFPSAFNRTCTSEFLGLPATLAAPCSRTTV